MSKFFTLLATSMIVVFSLTPVCAAESQAPRQSEPLSLCRTLEFDGAKYAACSFDASIDRIKLFHTGGDEKPYGHFLNLEKSLAEKGEALIFAMNAGMYHDNRMPVGLYVEEGVELVAANANPGPGNFHMLPNGVFYVTDTGAGVMETREFLDAAPNAVHASQSGPMLVIDGAIHPKFLPDSNSRKRRNGVGVSEDGKRAVFVISDDVVNFHEFARLFRDELKTPNALYLDGTISRLFAPELGRNDPGVAMGPIVGVTISTGSP